MIVKSKGIVLHYIKYGDHSIIVRIFTEKYGYDSFLLNAIRSKCSKKSIGHFQPFSILDLTLYRKESRSLQRISEFKTHIPLHHIYQDFTKGAITLFLTEICASLLAQEPSANESLYEFTEQSICTFDQLKEGVSNFPLQFLLKLGAYLGYELENASSLFSSIDKVTPLSQHSHTLFEQLLHDPYGGSYALNGTLRSKMLDQTLAFYRHHAHIAPLKSLEVLRSILN